MSAELKLDVASGLELTRRPFAQARMLPGAVYTSPEIFQREQQGLFSGEWLCVGREADIPGPGDYFLKEISGSSIIVMRGKDAKVRAFYNVCRHRGARILDESKGRCAGRVLCPYHAWSYNLDGSLQAVPQAAEGLEKESLGLVSVRLETHESLLFVNLDDNAIPLARYFADLPDLTRFRIPELVCGKRIEYEVEANWKLLCENYSECYHCSNAHPQLHRITESISRGERKQEIGGCFNGGPMRLRDGIETMSMSGKSTLPAIPGLTHDDCRYVHYYVIYPNILLSPHPDYVLIHTAWPRSPGRTQVICEWLFTKEAVSQPNFDPRDVVEFWDVTNRQDWALCERTQLGVSSRGFRQGPYQPSEDCVHTFDRWYADKLAALL